MTKPMYSAQTFEPDNVANKDARHEWVSKRHEEAKARGAVCGRVTLSDDGDGMLFEAWDKATDINSTEPCWHYAAPTPRD